MTDREFKRKLKKIALVFFILLVLIILLIINVLNSKSADLSIFTNADGIDKLKVLGLNEDELKRYLVVFGNLVDDNYTDEQKTFNMISDFIENMCPTYEIKINENGTKVYDADIVKTVAQELQGKYISNSQILGYEYNESENTYTKINQREYKPYFLDFVKIYKNDDKIHISYKIAYMSDEQIMQYETGQAVDIEEKTIKATIIVNDEYQYSKFFISEITGTV